MNDENFLRKIFQKIFPRRQAQRSGPESIPQARLYNLLKRVEQTGEMELSCNEVFELLDQYVELVVQKENAAELLPLVKEHIDRCRDCHEEYEALVRVIEGTTTSDT